MAAKVLEAAGLVKRYRRTTAVDGVSLAVGAGERVALLGANGAGKTTTLLMLLGAITPDAPCYGLGRAIGNDMPPLGATSEATSALSFFGFVS